MTAYLTERQRYTIEDYLKAKIPVSKIAKHLEKARSTIYAEIKKGSLKMINSDLTESMQYCADYAQMMHDEAVKAKGINPKLMVDKELHDYIEKRLLVDDLSPDACIGRMQHENLHFKSSVCTRTVYNAIHKGLFENFDRHCMIYNKKPKKQKDDQDDDLFMETVRPDRKRIDDRPVTIDDRNEFGHWELDLVVSARGASESLMVLVERLSRQSMIFLLPNKRQESIKRVFDFLEKRFQHRFKLLFKTITTDNGPEFINPDLIENSILTDKNRTQVYYCHPYSSWEKGTVENLNRFIRRIIPKSEKLSGFTAKMIKETQDWINRYPRKILNYYTSEEVFRKELQALFYPTACNSL